MEKMTFEQVFETIRKYYKEEKGVIIDSYNVDYLSDIYKEKYKDGGLIGPFHITRSNFGLTTFYLTKDDISAIMRSVYSKKLETEDTILIQVEEGFEYSIYCYAKDKDNKANIVYSSSMGYEQLLDLITACYNKEHNTRVSLLEVGSLITELKKAKDDNTKFYVSSSYGPGIYITKGFVKKIIREQLNKCGFELATISFEEQALLKFKDNGSKIEIKEPEKPKVEEPKRESNCIVTNPFCSKEEKKEETGEPEIIETTVDGTTVQLYDLPETKEILARLIILESKKKVLEEEEKNDAMKRAALSSVRKAIMACLCATAAIIVMESRGMGDKQYTIDNNFSNIVSIMDEMAEDAGPLGTALWVTSAGFILSAADDEIKYRRLKRKKSSLDDSISQTLNDLDKRID